MLKQLLSRWARLSALQKWAIVALVILILACAFFFPLPSPAVLRAWVSSAGVWAPVVYLCSMILCTQLPFPRTVWTITAGLLFHPVVAVFLMLLGLGVSATLSLIIFRRVGSKLLRQPDTDNEQVQRLMDLVDQRGWVAVFGLRLIPAVPFSLLNYACGLVRLPLPGFLFATVVGSAPNTVAVIVATSSLTSVDASFGFRLLGLGISAALMLAGLALASREAWMWRKLLKQ